MDFSVAIPWRSDNGIRAEIFEWTMARYKALFSGVNICLGDSLEEPFNRAASRNIAVAKSHTDLIVLADADTPPMLEMMSALHAINSSTPWAYPYDLYYSLTKQPTSDLLSTDPKGPILSVPLRSDFEFVMRSWAGAICMRRDAYNLLGGHDERFTGWGYEDTAFSHAAVTVLGEAARIHGRAYHLWHGRPLESTWEQSHIEANKALCDEYLGCHNRESMLEYISLRDKVGSRR